MRNLKLYCQVRLISLFGMGKVGRGLTVIHCVKQLLMKEEKTPKGYQHFWNTGTGNTRQMINVLLRYIIPCF